MAEDPYEATKDGWGDAIDRALGVGSRGRSQIDRECATGGCPEFAFQRRRFGGRYSPHYIAGHIGLDGKTGQAPADPEQEARLVMDGIKTTVEAAGLSMDEVVSVQIFCTD